MSLNCGTNFHIIKFQVQHKFKQDYIKGERNSTSDVCLFQTIHL